ncbi:MAG TPA: DUF72 domain-containing protein [Candidatus Bathyarchaeia archaeon]
MQNLYLGTIGFSYNFWKGNFYPNKTTPKDYLTYYSSQFNTVEIDSSFYRIPTEQTVNNWRKQVPEGFLFSLKFPKIITHIRMLKDCQYETKVFLDRADLLGEKLGALLLQFPPNFSVEHLIDLENFLQKLPTNHRYVVEVRNKSWLNKEFYSVLEANKTALAWADNPLMAQINELTADFLYFRWEGDRKKVNGTLGKIEADRAEDLKLVAENIKPFIEKQITLFGYFGKYYSGYPPSDIVNLQKHLSSKQCL